MKKLALFLIVPLLMGVSCSNTQNNNLTDKTSLDDLPEAVIEIVNRQKEEVKNDEIHRNDMRLSKCGKGKQIFYNFFYSYGFGDSESIYFDKFGNRLGRIVNTDTDQEYIHGEIPEQKDVKCEAIPLY